MKKTCSACVLVVMVIGLAASQTPSSPPKQTTKQEVDPTKVAPPDDKRVDRLFTLLKVITEEREQLVKEELKVKEKRQHLERAEQKVLAELRDIIQSQHKTLTDTQNRLKLFEEAIPSPHRPIRIGSDAK